MTKVGLIAILILLVTRVEGTNVTRLQSHKKSAREISTIQLESSNKVAVPLEEIDLSKIGHIAPKGRVQDKDYNELPIVDQLIANGKESIPFLISKLENETLLKEHVMDYWNEITIGDVAFIVLTDFFTDSSWKKTTIVGVSWKRFLGCEGHDLPANQCFGNYVSKYGRKSVKAEWQRIWDENKERLYWDEVDRSFRVNTP